MVPPKYPCGVCHKNVNKKGIFCEKCNFWHHAKCNDISVSEYEALCSEPDDVPWFCINCTITYHELIFPFGSIENETLSILYSYILLVFQFVNITDLFRVNHTNLHHKV